LLFKNYFISLQPEAEKIIPIIGQEKVFLLPTPHRMLRDLKSLIILLILELAYCIASSFLPRHALLVTALREARRIMKPLSLWLGESPLRGALSEQYPDSAGEVRVIPSNQYKLIENLVELLPKLPGSRKLELTKQVLQSLEEIVGVTV